MPTGSGSRTKMPHNNKMEMGASLMGGGRSRKTLIGATELEKEQSRGLMELVRMQNVNQSGGEQRSEAFQRNMFWGLKPGKKRSANEEAGVAQNNTMVYSDSDDDDDVQEIVETVNLGIEEVGGGAGAESESDDDSDSSSSGRKKKKKKKSKKDKKKKSKKSKKDTKSKKAKKSKKRNKRSRSESESESGDSKKSKSGSENEREGKRAKKGREEDEE